MIDPQREERLLAELVEDEETREDDWRRKDRERETESREWTCPTS